MEPKLTSPIHIFRIPVALALVVFYCIVAFPFLLWHERHLPINFGIVLSLFAVFLGAIIFFLSVHLFSAILRHGFHPLVEGIIVLAFLVSASLSGFFSNSGGRVFLILLGSIAFLLRFVRVKLYYTILLMSMLLLSNSLLTFLCLQKLEVFTAYYLFRSRFSFQEVDLSDWHWVENSRILTNRSIPIQITVPDGLYFHNPKNLNLKEKTGVGQIAGIFSISEKDPNVYPYIRLFFFPVYLKVGIEEIREEFIRWNNYLVQQGEIEEVNEIQPNRDFTINGKIPPNAFWTFYDILRPRYSKTGFYLMESSTGSKIVFHITENLEKGMFHEPIVQRFLEGLQWESSEFK